MSKDYPKPVESGELREKLAIIRNKMFDGMYDHMPEKGCTAVTDDVMAEIEALIAQEKAEWVAEMERTVIGEDDEVPPRPTGKEYLTRSQRTAVSKNVLRAKQRKALAKLLDKENV